MNRKGYLSTSWRILILLALALSACKPPITPTPPAETPTVQPSETPTRTPSGTPTGTPVVEETATLEPTPLPTQPVIGNPNFGLVCERNENLNPDQVLETTPFFIKGQVILTGPAESINRGVTELAARGMALTPVFRCTLGVPRQMPDARRGEQPFKKEATREGRNASFPFLNPQGRQPVVEGALGLAMNLYQFDHTRITLAQILDQLNAVQANLPRQARVYADANYLTGHLANTACGNPFGVEGSPFGVEGSPFGVEGSPNGGLGVDADPAGFWDQWAFQRIGLDLPGQRQFEETGEGVRVGVFDTSPYTQTYLSGAPPLVETETAITPTLTLTVHYPYPLPVLQATPPVTAQVDVSDHGLFVSSLVHALAYQSEIHLYRVLDDSGCGDLFRLNLAMLDFLSEGWSVEGLKQPAVINLSLGVRKPSELPSGPARAEAEAEIADMEQEIQDAYVLAQSDSSLESLETVVSLADLAGIVIVAAAGNDSVFNDPPTRTPPLLNMPLPMDLPADYPFVIGVSASTDQDGPSCYSNLGDVAAPGGEAKEGADSRGDPNCETRAPDCPQSDANVGIPGSCEFGVMGLSKQSSSGYAYWAGTSFATPLASGLAALVYQRTSNPANVSTRITTQVDPILDARYGQGLIQVQKALTP